MQLIDAWQPFVENFNWRIVGYIALAIWLFGWVAGRCLTAWFKPEDGARKIHEDAKQLYSASHEFCTVDPADFRGADHAFYASAEAKLIELGFRKVADLEDVTVSRVYPKMRTFIRAMGSGDGTTVAGIYHVRMRGWMRLLAIAHLIPKDIRTTDFETELSDGTFVVTANTEGLDLSSAVPGIERRSLAKETPLEELWAKHCAHIAEIAAHHGAARRIGSTVADYVGMQHRIDALKNRAKAAAGFVDLEQFDRCGNGMPPVEEVVQMRSELEQIQAREQARQS